MRRRATSSWPPTARRCSSARSPVTGTLSGSGTKYFSDGSSSSLRRWTAPAAASSSSPPSSTAGYVRERSLDVRGDVTIAPNGTNAATSRVETLAVSGRLDLTDNKLIVADRRRRHVERRGYTGVTGLVDSGRGNAGNAQWNGAGIVTTDTRAINNDDLVSIGVATAPRSGIADTATTPSPGRPCSAPTTSRHVHLGRRRQPRRQDQHRRLRPDRLQRRQVAARSSAGTTATSTTTARSTSTTTASSTGTSAARPAFPDRRRRRGRRRGAGARLHRRRAARRGRAAAKTPFGGSTHQAGAHRRGHPIKRVSPRRPGGLVTHAARWPRVGAARCRYLLRMRASGSVGDGKEDIDRAGCGVLCWRRCHSC